MNQAEGDRLVSEASLVSDAFQRLASLDSDGDGEDMAEAHRADEQTLRETLEAVHSAAIALCATTELPDVLGTLVDRARELAGAAYAAVGLASAGGEAPPFESWTWSGLTAEQAAALGAAPQPAGLLAAVIGAGAPASLHDAAREPRYASLLGPGAPPIGAFLGVPLLRRGRPLGYLFVANEQAGRPLTEEHRHGIELLVEHAALALENVILRDRMEQTQRELDRAARESTAQERMYRSLFEEAFDGILVADDAGRLLDVNARACEMFRSSREELLRRMIFQLGPPEGLPALVDLWGRFLEEGRMRAESLLQRADGSTFEGEFAARARFLPGRHLSSLRDISESKRAIEALRRSEESLARAQRIAHIGNWDWNIITGEVLWSEESSRIFGRSPCANPGPRYVIGPVVHPDDREAVSRALEAAVERGEAYSLDFRSEPPDGPERLVHSEADVIRDAEGRPTRMIGTVQDVTEQRRAEKERDELLAALSDERRWLQAVIERSPVGILLCEGRGAERIVANRRAVELLGLPTPLMGDLSLLRDRIFQPDGSPPSLGELLFEQALRGETVTGREQLVRRPDGTEIPVLTSASPIRSDQGERLGAVVIYEDISALKEFERLREEWTSVVAHDLRQPVTAMMATASLLTRRLEDPSARGKAERIYGSARRLSRMIDDLLDVSQLETRRLELVRAGTDLPALLASVIDQVAEGAERERISLSVSVSVSMSGPLPPIPLDPQRIEQVVENLLTNALKYSTPGTPIGVHVERHAGQAVVSVRSHGPGITPAELPLLFERFQRGRTWTGKVKGLGLGLYICRGLVEAHGGRIAVESIPEQVTTFSFTLPMARPDPAEERPVARDDARG